MGRSKKSPISAKSRIRSTTSGRSRRAGSPSRRALWYRFSRPVRSGVEPRPQLQEGIDGGAPTWKRPSVGCSTPDSTFRSVDLPEPLGPMTPKQSPRGTVNDMSRNAQKSVCRRARPAVAHSSARCQGVG